MLHEFLGKKILFVTAHPDDEAFLAGGTIYANNRAGGENILFCATRGEKGRAYVPDNMSSEELALLRSQELLSVASFLGIVQVEQKSFPDGGIGKNLQELRDSLFQFVFSISPDYIVSFAEDGFTGHQDHKMVHQVVKTVTEQTGIAFLQFAHPPQAAGNSLHQHFKNKRKHGVYEDCLDIDSHGLIHVPVDKVKKLQALEMYKTQFKGLNPYVIFPAEVAEHVLCNEYFIKK